MGRPVRNCGSRAQAAGPGMHWQRNQTNFYNPHAQEGASVNRNMNFIDRFIHQSNREGRESNAQSCTLGQHTLFDSYCAYPLRTPSLTESKHYAFDPFELLDGDSELLACLIQVQLAADEKGQTTRAFTPYSSK